MFKNIAGKSFGLLTAIERTGEMTWGASLWRCRCACGKEAIAAINSLNQGTVQSCGCLRSTKARLRGDFHGERATRTYKSWDNMIQRCTNPRKDDFNIYGGMGTKVCERWRSYRLFKEDMGERPEGMTLDRIDPNGDYEPGNCRWADVLTQARNKKKKTTTFAQAEEARRLYAQGRSPKSIRLELGITEGSLNGILYLGYISKP